MPYIEPEVSRTKMSSLGVTSSARGASVGTTSSLTKPSLPPARWATAPEATLSGATRRSRRKSRLAMRSDRSSVTRARLGPCAAAATAGGGDGTPRGGPPAAMAPVSATRWAVWHGTAAGGDRRRRRPVRVGGRVALGVGAGDEARADGEREREVVGAVAVREGVDVLQRDGDRLARRDVRHRLGEQVRALLVEERRRVAAVARAPVVLLRVGTFLEDAADDAVADAHLVAVDGRLAGKR